MSLCKRHRDTDACKLGGGGMVCWVMYEVRELVVGGAMRGQVMRILEHEAKEPGLHPGALGTHERALRSRGLFFSHSRRMHMEESKLEEEQEDQSEADDSPRSLDQHGGDGDENRRLMGSLERC